eukprot:s2941_g6.t1
MHSSNTGKVQSAVLQKPKLDPWPIPAPLLAHAARQHEYPVWAAFAFTCTGIARKGLYGHSPPSDINPATSNSLQLDLESR